MKQKIQNMQKTQAGEGIITVTWRSGNPFETTWQQWIIWWVWKNKRKGDKEEKAKEVREDRSAKEGSKRKRIGENRRRTEESWKGVEKRENNRKGKKTRGRRVSSVASCEAPHAQNPARNSSSCFIPRLLTTNHHHLLSVCCPSESIYCHILISCLFCRTDHIMIHSSHFNSLFSLLSVYNFIKTKN